MEKSQLTRGIDDFWNGPSLVGCFLHARIEKDSRLGYRHLKRRQITLRALILGEMMADSLKAQLRSLRDELDDLKAKFKKNEDAYKELFSTVQKLTESHVQLLRKINTLSGSRVQHGTSKWIDVNGIYSGEQGHLIIGFESNADKISRILVAPVKPADVSSV
jgi:hypothetical protein